MSSSDQTPFYDLSPEDYPILFEFLTASGDVVHTIKVDGPGIIQVPSLHQEHGPISVRTTYGDGSVHIQCPEGMSQTQPEG